MFIKNDALGIEEISCENLSQTKKFVLIDVRRPDEYNGELGHIEGATLVTLGPELENKLNEWDKDKTYVFICRSGGRSGQATAYAQSIGYKKVYNMMGGMLEWNRLGLPVSKSN